VAALLRRAPPNGESLEMCAERAVAYFKEQVEPLLFKGQNVLIAAHGNSLRAIIMYLDSLTSQEVRRPSLPPSCPCLLLLPLCPLTSPVRK